MNRDDKNEDTLIKGEAAIEAVGVHDEYTDGDYTGIRYAPDDATIEAAIEAQRNPDTEHLNHYLCETCDAEADLTEEEAYNAGWDYPPFIGVWGILSPRTCPNCLIDTTAYWAVLTRAGLTERHRKTIERVMAETEGASDH